MKKPDLLLGLDKNQLIQVILKQREEYEQLQSTVEEFVEKNHTGGAKSEREDYVTLVSARDLWKLKQSLPASKHKKII